MATNGDFSDEDFQPGSAMVDADGAADGAGEDFDDQEPLDKEEKPLKSAMKKSSIHPLPQQTRPQLPEQPEPDSINFSMLTPLSPEIISRQATQNIGTIGHVAQSVGPCHRISRHVGIWFLV